MDIQSPGWSDFLVQKARRLTIVRSSVKREGVGWPALFMEENEPITFCGFIIRARLEKILASPEYVTYYLRSNLIREKIVEGSSQVTITNINQKTLGNIPILIPPLSEQHRIVARIEELFSRLDAGAEALQKAKAQLKRYRQAVLKAAAEGRLTEEWRKVHPDVEPSDELLKRILVIKQARSGKAFSGLNGLDLTGLPKLPDSWLWVRLDALASLKGGITKDTKRKVENGRRVPYLRVANVQRGYLDLSEIKEIEASEETISELRLEQGDILFNEGGDRDKLGRGWIWQKELPECIHQNHVFRARLYSKEVSNKFVSWFGNTYGKNYFLKEGKQTTNLASVNLTKLSAFPVPLPPNEENEIIVGEVERRLSICDESEKILGQNLIYADKLRQSVLKCAFEGRLVPQDPNDEPASVLPERIKAESAKEAPRRSRRNNNTRQMRLIQ